MKSKKLIALFVCIIASLVLFTFMASAVEKCADDAHKFEVVTYDQTCTTEGRYEYTCVVCGYQMTEKIPKHNFHYVYTREYPNCAREGIDIYYCDWCNLMEEKVTPVDLTEHSYGDWEIVREATCGEEGEKKRVCRNKEGCVEYYIIPADSTKHVAKEGGFHSIDLPSCYEKGTETNECAVCGQLYTTEIAIHGDYEINPDKYTVVKDVKATCAVPDSKTYLCVCGVSFTVTGKINPDKHNYEKGADNWIYTEGASCKHPGKLIKKCQNSPHHQIEEEYAPHIFEGVQLIVKEPGCNADGTFNTGLKTTKCLYCDEVKEEIITDEVHTYGDWEILTGNCANGGTAVRRCVNHPEVTEEKTFNPDEHLNYEIIDIQLPTCKHRGYYLAKCKVEGCKEDYVYILPENLAARGYHIDGEWVVTVQPSCLNSGERKLYCDVCEEVIETEIMLQENHSCIILEAGYAATCTENGYTDRLYCISCEQTFEKELIRAEGHNFVEQFTPEEGSVRICDKCFEYEIGNVTCKCLCHNSNSLAKALWKFVIVFCRIFGMNQECKCGIAHF